MQRKRQKDYGKKRTSKLTTNKHVGRRKGNMKTCLIEVKIPGIQRETIICAAPVVKVGVQKRITGKSIRKNSIYRLIGEKEDSEWGIAKASSPFRTPNNLIDSQIIVTNGKRVVKGTIIKASIVGGGATSPPTGDGLPPVDE